MNKATREAIEHKFPMHWEIDADCGGCRLLLIAITYTYENGYSRTRKLWATYNAREAHYVHGEILRQGGAVSEPTPKTLFELWQERI